MKMHALYALLILLTSGTSQAESIDFIQCGSLNGILLTTVKIERSVIDAGSARARIQEQLKADLILVDRWSATLLAVGVVTSSVVKDNTVYASRDFSLSVKFDYSTFKLIDQTGAYSVEGTGIFILKKSDSQHDSIQLNCTKFDQM